DFVIYFDNTQIPDKKSASLSFKNLCFLPKPENQELLLDNQEIDTALKIAKIFNKKWKPFQQEQLCELYSLKVKGTKLLKIYEEFNEIQTPVEIIQFFRNNFGDKYHEPMYLQPNQILTVIFRNLIYPDEKIAPSSLDIAYWQAQILSKLGYETYILSELTWNPSSYNPKIIYPKWNFYCAYKDKETGYISLLKENNIQSTNTRSIEDLLKNLPSDNWYCIKFDQNFQKIQNGLLAHYVKAYKLKTPENKQAFINRIINENIFYFKKGVGVDPVTHLPYDHILLDKDGNILRKGDYTQPPIIGMYLALLAGIAKGDIPTAEISPQEALLELKEALKTVQEMPKWNGLLYNWYKLGDKQILPLGTLEDDAVRVVLYEEGYFTASLALVIGAMLEEAEKNPLAKDILQMANEIMEEQKKGWELLCGKINAVPVYLEVDRSLVTEEVRSKLKTMGEWDKLLNYVKSDFFDEECHFRILLQAIITAHQPSLEEIKAIIDIDDLKNTPLYQHILKIGLNAIGNPQNSFSSTDLNKNQKLSDLYMDSRIAVIMSYILGAVNENAWGKLGITKGTYTLLNGEKINIWKPYNGAFQAWGNLLFFPEMEWSPQGLAIAHRNYALVQLDFAERTGLPALFSASSNPYPEENKGEYVYTWDLGVPGASALHSRGNKPIATPHATALLFPIFPERALRLSAELELKYPGIKAPLGWRDSIGINGEVSNTFLGLDQLFLLLGLNVENNYRYMKNYLAHIGKLNEVKKLFSETVFW
ncbi:MAG: hypothetical protein J7L14_04000, partial [Candidatus Diapherotrites archaeon]|nr:hypothetical protein [Candidatus Diapherotrites archaeon]